MHRYITVPVILICVFFLTSYSNTGAQDTIPLSYGEATTGDFTDTIDAINYTFTGKAGDIVVIWMTSLNFAATIADTRPPEFLYPKIILLDADQTQLAEETGIPIFDAVTLTVELKTDGDYTVVATRAEKRPLSESSFNTFKLTLYQAKPLANGVEITTTLSNKAEQYYAIRVDKPFTISYQKMAGDFDPLISLEFPNAETPINVAYISGQSARKATLSFDVEKQTAYVLRIRAAPEIQAMEEELSVDYTLSYNIDL